MAVHAFDIDAAVRAADPTSPLPARGFRWVHWDLGDPALAGWLDSHLPPRAAAALRQAETRPRAFAEGDGLVLILRGVNLNPGQLADDMVSLRAWAGPGLVITARMRRVIALDSVRDGLEADPPASPMGLLARIAEALTDRVEAETLKLEDRVHAMEEDAFGEAARALPDLGRLRRAAIRLARFARPQAVALEDAARSAPVLADAAAAAAMAEAANRARRADELLDAARQRLMALGDHLEMAQTGRLGRNAYLLSVIAAVFLPLGFLTGLFGVNVAGMPGIESGAAFWVLIAACVAVAGVVAVILRWLRLF